MSVKLTKSRTDDLIDTLDALICDEAMLTREQRENMVLCVATLGALGERFSQLNTKNQKVQTEKADKKEKKPREPDPVFTRNGKPWTDKDIDLIHSIIDDIQYHIIWLSEKQSRTPYAIALKIVSEGRCDTEWAKTFQPLAKEIREQHVSGLMEAKLQNATFTLRLIPATVADPSWVPKAKRELWLCRYCFADRGVPSARGV
ncbi:hypothetical protein [Yokenella regensburgei]|uniref:hypothetical protein n=1 Tax=Yokenella regensburgei TaxID=158877 RepID=UPI003ED9CDDC